MNLVSKYYGQTALEKGARTFISWVVLLPVGGLMLFLGLVSETAWPALSELEQLPVSAWEAPPYYTRVTGELRAVPRGRGTIPLCLEVPSTGGNPSRHLCPACAYLLVSNNRHNGQPAYGYYSNAQKTLLSLYKESGHPLCTPEQAIAQAQKLTAQHRALQRGGGGLLMLSLLLQLHLMHFKRR